MTTATSPFTQATYVECDLSSQKSVRHAAAEVAKLVPHIDILINNAAIAPGVFRKSEDGIESQFAVDHIGHFLLTNLLMPKILTANSKSRIVNVASSAYRHRQHADFSDYNFNNGKTYSGWQGYMQASL
jgi:NAD(P)-dependent dehydrogenase (short-subunit alcohol dehydrogenase family)